MADGALFRGVRRSQCLPSRRAHRDRAVAPRPHWFGLPTDCRHRAGDSGTLPDGSGFDSTWAEIILRKDAWRVVLDRRPLSKLLAVLLVSLALGSHTSYGSLPLLVLTAIVWLSLAAMIAIMLTVSPGHGPNPNVPRMFGWSNRLFMVAYGVWLMVVAWPIAR